MMQCAWCLWCAGRTLKAKQYVTALSNQLTS